MKKVLIRTSSLALAIAMFSCVTNSLSAFASVSGSSSKKFNIGDIKATASTSYSYHSSATSSTSCTDNSINYLFVTATAKTGGMSYSNIDYINSPGIATKTVYNGNTIGSEGYHYGEAQSGNWTGSTTTSA